MNIYQLGFLQEDHLLLLTSMILKFFIVVSNLYSSIFDDSVRTVHCVLQVENNPDEFCLCSVKKSGGMWLFSVYY